MFWHTGGMLDAYYTGEAHVCAMTKTLAPECKYSCEMSVCWKAQVFDTAETTRGLPPATNVLFSIYVFKKLHSKRSSLSFRPSKHFHGKNKRLSHHVYAAFSAIDMRVNISFIKIETGFFELLKLTETIFYVHFEHLKKSHLLWTILYKCTLAHRIVRRRKAAILCIWLTHVSKIFGRNHKTE